MPTSASTGTEQVGPDAKSVKAEIAEKHKEDKAETGETTVANTEVITKAHTDRNTPDGAPVVTREDEVVGGVRVDLPPSAPASPSATDLANRQGGTFQVARPDGTFANIDSDDPDFEEHAKAIREGKANH